MTHERHRSPAGDPAMVGCRPVERARPWRPIVGLDSERPMRVYLEAVRDGQGEASLADLEHDMRRRGTYPDGGLRLDLRLPRSATAAQGLVTASSTRGCWSGRAVRPGL
jgi:hypothetical protein